MSFATKANETGMTDAPLAVEKQQTEDQKTRRNSLGTGTPSELLIFCKKAVPAPLYVECRMPKLTVEGYGTFDVAENKRLVLAIEQDAQVDILHACGGNARCTTCRVEFIDGEPLTMTAAEKERLEQRELTGVRLSCQILCDHDMSVRAISRLEGSGRPDPGRTPEETIQPPPGSVPDPAAPIPRAG